MTQNHHNTQQLLSEDELDRVSGAGPPIESGGYRPDHQIYGFQAGQESTLGETVRGENGGQVSHENLK